jgi:rhodanese-related sulfurtransferase
VSRYGGIDALLSDARSRLRRLLPEATAAQLRQGALLVDIRPVAQRVEHGEVPGSLIIERNVLEWRLDPTSDGRLDASAPGQFWIIICQEGYTSSLAADVLTSIGVPATDVVGGYVAWRAAGLPTVQGGTPADRVVGG